MESTSISENKFVKKLKCYSSDNSNEDGISYGFSKAPLPLKENNVAQMHKHEKKFFFASAEENNIQSLSDANKLTSLRPRGAVSNGGTDATFSTKHSWENTVILEREILPSDTLQSFALLYGCTLNDLKRVNNLINEQDFFALRQIKIPVKKYGLMTELEEEIKRRPAASTQNITTSFETYVANSITAQSSDVYHTDSQDEDVIENQTLLQKSYPVNSKITAVYHNDASKFLKNVDKEIRNTVKIVNATGKNETLEEVVSSLGSVGFQPLPIPSATNFNECDGANWGLTWSTLLVSFVFGFVLVIVFIILKSSFPLGF